MPATERWDIFCSVVDNYGDAGVCWRLARELAHEHGVAVTLWIDDVAPLSRLAEGVDAAHDDQRVSSVRIRRWADPLPGLECADAIIEAFGCGLPGAYVEAMRRDAVRPAWFVLEYLSAEAWIDDSHGLPSPHPRLPFVRRFWFPGFTARSGGLLRERGLLDERDAFRADPFAQDAFWRALRVPSPVPGEVRASLFCYAGAPAAALLEAWAGSEVQVTCVVPAGTASAAIERWAGRPVEVGASISHGHLTLFSIPFVTQDVYDRLLWSCTVNFVRGEDSFVRAQWAARALVWNAYPQAEGAHWRKHDAFLDRYTEGLDAASAGAVRRFSRAWNGDVTMGAIAGDWSALCSALGRIEQHGAVWARRLSDVPELAAGLVKASRNRV